MHEEEKGSPGYTPNACVRDRPRLGMLESYYLGVFSELSPSRQIGMGAVGAIVYSEITNYCCFHNVLDPDFLIEVIQRVDAAYLGIVNKTQE